MQIPIACIVPNPMQPRSDFDPDALQVLADSLATHGLVQAVSVEAIGDGRFQLIAGERRLRAAQLLGWSSIEATILEPSPDGDPGRLQLALVENLHRADMGPLEKARGYQLLRESGLSDAMIAKRIGSSTSNVWLYRALLNFEPEIQALYAAGSIAIDQRLVHAMRKLDSATRVRIMVAGAERGFTSEKFRAACERALNRPAKRAPDPDASSSDSGSDIVPSIRLGARGGFKWEAAYRAVVQTCRRCDFIVSQSDTICDACPLVLAVTLMTKGVSDGSR